MTTREVQFAMIQTLMARSEGNVGHYGPQVRSLLEIRGKGPRAFWQVSALLGTGIEGTVVAGADGWLRGYFHL